MSSEMTGSIFRLNPQVWIESFDDGAIVFRFENYQMTELNTTAGAVLIQTDGARNVEQVASALAEQYEIPLTEAVEDVTALYQQFLAQKIVKRIHPGQDVNAGVIPTSASCRSNLGIVLREEDKSGGYLFNPATGRVKFVNITGLFIWKQLRDGQKISAIVDAAQTAFEGAPAAEILADVQAFLGDMISSGFVSLIEPV